MEESDSEEEEEMEKNNNQDSKFDFVMKCFGHPHHNCKPIKQDILPDYLKLRDVYPGEPPFMKKRKFPAVLRFHKFKIDTHPQEYFFSEALLYRPFKNEQDILDDLEKKDAAELNEEIQCVKSNGVS